MIAKTSSDSIRSFIGIKMPDEIIKEVARIGQLISNKRFNGKLTELENLHLTLKFLGDLNLEELEEVKKRLRNINIKHFLAKLGPMGTFSFNGVPKIVWCKINGPGIFQLQKEVDYYLKDLFKLEKRFMSHVTIARIKYINDPSNFIDYIANISTSNISWKIDKFTLIQSKLDRNGPSYIAIEEFNLQ